MAKKKPIKWDKATPKPKAAPKKGGSPTPERVQPAKTSTPPEQSKPEANEPKAVNWSGPTKATPTRSKPGTSENQSLASDRGTQASQPKAPPESNKPSGIAQSKPSDTTTQDNSTTINAAPLEHNSYTVTTDHGGSDHQTLGSSDVTAMLRELAKRVNDLSTALHNLEYHRQSTNQYPAGTQYDMTSNAGEHRDPRIFNTAKEYRNWFYNKYLVQSEQNNTIGHGEYAPSDSVFGIKHLSNPEHPQGVHLGFVTPGEKNPQQPRMTHGVPTDLWNKMSIEEKAVQAGVPEYATAEINKLAGGDKKKEEHLLQQAYNYHREGVKATAMDYALRQKLAAQHGKPEAATTTHTATTQSKPMDIKALAREIAQQVSKLQRVK